MAPAACDLMRGSPLACMALQPSSKKHPVCCLPCFRAQQIFSSMSSGQALPALRSRQLLPGLLIGTALTPKTSMCRSMSVPATPSSCPGDKGAFNAWGAPKAWQESNV